MLGSRPSATSTQVAHEQRIVQLEAATSRLRDRVTDLERVTATPAYRGVGHHRPARRLLVLAEDDEDACEILARLLTARGHQVVQARDGRSAVVAIERLIPDAAIVDIGLPGLDGYGVARRIRSGRTFDAVLLVALTAHGIPEVVQAAYDAGFDVHLTKPADIERLEAALVARRGQPGRVERRP